MNTLYSPRLPAARRLMVPALLCLFYASQSFAMGDNSTGSKTPDCPNGQIYDSVSKKCVPAKTSSLSDQDKTSYAYHLAKKGEYPGEAWMIKGRRDLAQEQLQAIAGICGQGCEEYRDLRAAIDGHPES
ncbi:TPA: hypothetical protein ACPYU1_004030 [Raoultella planticola]